MITPENILYLLIAYLMGSIPTSVWIGQYFYNIDVREFGSGNSGATNTFRVLGYKAGIPVLIIDVLKGWTSVKLAGFISDFPAGSEQLVNLELVFAVAALMGHVFPVYVGFRGGKGVATLLGIVLALNTTAALISLGVFIVVFVATKYVSLSSIIASFAFPNVVIFAMDSRVPSMVIFSMFITVIVLVTHQKNIERLLSKRESKITFRKKTQSVEQSE
ncbi:MAG: glycerol-3-phosphate 1-O-acyltransferase PlsY [Bacteroidetes bacterium]|nr:glycerol-3-phosphate 1-O-acyltransferase PlsY [Bacteroidota bacterium]MBK9670775.1 glycerol-3-phosphate 1-O-acyltransferase PlsY [Bacteroidota bacterium]MBK9799949.1 glycerol-3-phosphate 1-O-acyltransferase PlsY [Bacteroidota bacterium]